MPKRGMNIYKRKDGRWEGRVGRENAPDGSRRYVSVYGKTYGEVKARMEGLPRSGTACGAPGEGTMGEAVGLWLEEIGRAHV